MKKGKITVGITVAIACFALMTVMFMQFKIVNETDITSIETMREEELRTELANWKQKYSEAEEQYDQKKSKLEEYREKKQSEEQSSELIKKELEQTNMYMGTTDVKGEGIIITIKDITDSSIIKPINEEDLLTIVDYLKLAGAEAISINEQRITNMSEIVYVSESVIYINQQRILAPYVIKAIGDSTKLESTLLGNGGYVETLKDLGFDITIEKGKIKIPKYEKEISSKYIQ